MRRDHLQHPQGESMTAEERPDLPPWALGRADTRVDQSVSAFHPQITVALGKALVDVADELLVRSMAKGRLAVTGVPAPIGDGEDQLVAEAWHDYIGPHKESCGFYMYGPPAICTCGGWDE